MNTVPQDRESRSESGVDLGSPIAQEHPGCQDRESRSESGVDLGSPIAQEHPGCAGRNRRGRPCHRAPKWWIGSKRSCDVHISLVVEETISEGSAIVRRIVLRKPVRRTRTGRWVTI